MSNVKGGRIVILLSVLVAECFCLEIGKRVENPSPCRENQCTGQGESKSSSVPELTPTTTKPDDAERSTRRTVPESSSQPTPEELEDVHRRVLDEIRENEHPSEPETHVLERWGFFVMPTFGDLELKRDNDYAEGIRAFEEMIKDDKKLTKRQQDDINTELEKFLQDDHSFQVWSAHVYKQEKHKRKKRGIPEHDIYPYHEMPNPYYQKK